MSIPGKQRTKLTREKYMYAKTANATNDADNNNIVSPRDLLLEEMKIVHFHVRLADTHDMKSTTAFKM